MTEGMQRNAVVCITLISVKDILVECFMQRATRAHSLDCTPPRRNVGTFSHFNCRSTPTEAFRLPPLPDLSLHSAVMSVLWLQACPCSLLILPFSSRAIWSAGTRRPFQTLIKHSWCRCAPSLALALARSHFLSFLGRYAHTCTP